MKRRVALLARLAAHAALAALPVVSSTAADAAERFTVTIQGQQAGAMSVERGAAGELRVEYSYRDNGRGPDMQETFRVGEAERVLDYRVRGSSTFGGEIREDFAFADGRLRWNSKVDRGDEAAAPGGVFVPLESSPAYWSQLLRAVLAQPGQRAVAPGGAQLASERLAQIEVDGPQGKVAVALYATTGADVEPWYIWLRDDASRAFYAVVWPGFLVAPAGHESAGPALLARQMQAQAERLTSIRQRSTIALPGLTLIRSVRWFDAKAAAMRGPSDVYLFDGRIAALTPPGALDAGPQQVIDGAGRSLLPGLWDMHAHIWPGAAIQHLAAGVTSVRDLANQNDDLLKLKARIDRGEIAGPHVVPAGFIEGRSPFSSRNGVVVATLEEGLRAVDAYAARGYRQIKLYNSIRPEWVKPLAARAHAHGMTVAGHVPAFMRAEQAVQAGYDELTHINQVMLNFFVRPDQDTRTLLRFTLVGEEARKVRTQSPEVRRFIALLRRHGTAVDPTLGAFEAMFTQRDGEPNPSLAAVVDHLPVLWRRGMLNSEMSPTAEQAARYRPSYTRMLELTGALHRAGVPLVAGTDGTPGLLLHRELELYVRAGIPAPEVLRIATWNGARIAGEGARSGSIERGKDADLVLIEGDPARDIGHIRRTSLVIKGREAYSPSALYESLGMRPFAADAVVQRPLPAAR